MSKRVNTCDRFGSSLNHKKPKLDILVQKRGEINYGASTSNSNTNNTFRKPNSVPIVPNIWNDDDDDDLLIISQMVENKIQSDVGCGGNSEGFENISITFEHFGSHVQSSTQLQTSSGKTATKAASNHNVESSSLFEDSFDFEWGNGNSKNEKNDIFHKPSITVNNSAKKGLENVEPKLMSLKNNDFSTIQTDFTATSINNDRQRDAIEIDKLIQSLDALQTKNKSQLKQINTLSEQINDLNEKIQTKEGEASILRHELRSSKQALDTLRIQKISENDTIRKEYQHKIIELERVKNGIQAELNQRKIENAQLKQKKAVDGNAIEIIRKYQELSEINRLNFRFKETIKQTNLNLPKEILSKNETFNNSLIEKHFQSQYDLLCSALLQWNYNICDENSIKRFENIFQNAIEKLVKYLKLDSSKFCNESTFKSYKQSNICTLCSKKSIKMKSAFFGNKITEFERMIPFRRFIAILSYIIKNIPDFQTYMLNSIKVVLTSTRQNFDTILELITNSVNIDHYMGILESIALVLTTLAETESFVETYLKYFNIIAHCIPNLRIMAEITDCIQEISKNKFYLNKMCKTSSKFKISYSTNKKIVKIPKTGCILQTFCTILEYKILQQEKNLYEHKFEIFRILENYIKFLGNCFKAYPAFMINPNCINSNNESRNTYDINHSICNCYALVCCSFVFLFSKFLHFWMEDKNAFNIGLVQEVCKTGLILLCDIFDSHYQPVIAFVGNTSVKRNLFLILDYLEKNKEIYNKEYENVITTIRNCSMLSDTELNIIESQQINSNGKKIIEKAFSKNLFL